MVDGKSGLKKNALSMQRNRSLFPQTSRPRFLLENRKADKWKDKPQENTTESQNNDMQTLADLLQHPVPDRDIKDFEE